MARPRNTEDDDRYNEESLNFVGEQLFPTPDPDKDDILPELGETDRRDSFVSLNDEEFFNDNRT
jgi:hypothetical protein